MTSDNRKDLDSLIEEALSTYSRQEPRPGLEVRVLNRIRDAGPGIRFVFPRWAFAVPALACALMLFAWLQHSLLQQPLVQQPSRPVPPKAARTEVGIPQLNPAQVRSESRVAAEEKREHKHLIRSAAKHAPLPKLQQFPSPAPITKEERLLLALIARSPEKAREILFDDRQRSAEPIRIEEINIQPLQIDGSQ